LLPSQINKLVARAVRSNEPSTTAQTTTDYRQTDTIEIPGTEILGRIFNVSGKRRTLESVLEYSGRNLDHVSGYFPKS
jgi:hypothetical protein